MKCYYDRADIGRVEQISLAAAVRLVHGHQFEGEIQYLDAAMNMLQLSSHSNAVPVANGCVWIEDNMPVPGFDLVVKNWWALKVKELPDGYHHVVISLIKWTDGSGETRVGANTCDTEGNLIELNGTLCELIIAQLKEIKRVSAKPTHSDPTDVGEDDLGSGPSDPPF